MSTTVELTYFSFIGHWENSQIVVESFVTGDPDFQDRREDVGYWDEGLFCSGAWGRDYAEALALVRVEYESEYGEDLAAALEVHSLDDELTCSCGKRFTTDGEWAVHVIEESE